MSGAPLHAQVRFWRDPALPGVEARASVYTCTAFRTHTHRAFCVALVDRGATRFSLHGGLHEARAGALVLIEPEAPHACNPDPGTGMAYRLLSLEPGWLAGALGEVGRGPLRRFLSPVLLDAELFAAWAGLHEAFVQGAPAGEKQALLLACLRTLLSRNAAPGPGAEAPSPVVEAARQRIRESRGGFVPLDELARGAGLSRHHFLRVFKAATGLPPHAYQLQQAIEHAKDLLAGGVPISQAALDAGFADQSHFSRLFRQYTGATPRQYAEAEPDRP